jgi:hypothetical protein
LLRMISRALLTPAGASAPIFRRNRRSHTVRGHGGGIRGEPERRPRRPRWRAIARQHVARHVWPVATHQGELTARRLVITFVPTASRKLAVGFTSATAAHVRSRNPQPPDPVSLRCVVAQAALRARRGATLSKAIPSCHRQQTTGRKHITDRSKGARTHTDGQLARLSL